MSDLKNKTIITVATTGAWPTKANNPNVPMTPEEIAEDVYACWKAGAAVAHLHMRVQMVWARLNRLIKRPILI